MSIVLASGSPRRKELLEMLGVNNMKVIPAKGEEVAPEGLCPQELVKLLASAKGHEVAAQCSTDDVIIAADTIVWHDNQVYGKPHSREQAVEMLHSLSGRTHQVYTGVCVLYQGCEQLDYEMSQVHFRPLSDDEIERYVDTGEPMDKAGAYGAQGKAALFVQGIDGDFFNVMGLPLCRLGQMLKEQGVVLL
jgi:septum formation protein